MCPVRDDRDRNKALAQIENARSTAMENVKAMGSDVVPMEQEAKTLRLAVGLLEKRSTDCTKSTSSDGDDTSFR